MGRTAQQTVHDKILLQVVIVDMQTKALQHST